MFDDQTHQRSDGDAERGRDPEGLAVVDHERVGDRGTEHEDGAVCQVEDVENPEDKRVADREQGVDRSDEDRV
jgi:hypothetical protein